MNKKMYLVLHDIRSAHNVGSLFRTADGMGVSKIYLTGYTGAPIDRFGRKDSKISKVSLGAEDTVPWEKVGDTTELMTELIQLLHSDGVEVVALEQTKNSIPLHEYRTKKDIALIVGNEVEGVPEEILKHVDTVVEIPMYGKKESLNVSNAGAIALYELAHLITH